VVECRTCARLCPAEAITFPEEAYFAAFIKEKLALLANNETNSKGVE